MQKTKLLLNIIVCYVLFGVVGVSASSDISIGINQFVDCQDEYVDVEYRIEVFNNSHNQYITEFRYDVPFEDYILRWVSDPYSTKQNSLEFDISDSPIEPGASKIYILKLRLTEAIDSFGGLRRLSLPSFGARYDILYSTAWIDFPEEWGDLRGFEAQESPIELEIDKNWYGVWGERANYEFSIKPSGESEFVLVPVFISQNQDFRFEELRGVKDIYFDEYSNAYLHVSPGDDEVVVSGSGYTIWGDTGLERGLDIPSIDWGFDGLEEYSEKSPGDLVSMLGEKFESSDYVDYRDQASDPFVGNDLNYCILLSELLQEGGYDSAVVAGYDISLLAGGGRVCWVEYAGESGEVEIVLGPNMGKRDERIKSVYLSPYNIETWASGDFVAFYSAPIFEKKVNLSDIYFGAKSEIDYNFLTQRVFLTINNNTDSVVRLDEQGISRHELVKGILPGRIEQIELTRKISIYDIFNMKTSSIDIAYWVDGSQNTFEYDANEELDFFRLFRSLILYIGLFAITAVLSFSIYKAMLHKFPKNLYNKRRNY